MPAACLRSACTSLWVGHWCGPLCFLQFYIRDYFLILFFVTIFATEVLNSIGMGTLFRFRRKHVAEPLEPLPEPEKSIIDAKSDVGNEGGFHETGGVHLIEMHFPIVYGAGGMILFILRIVLFCYLISKGHLQKCCYSLAVACCGNGRTGDRDGGSGDAGNQDGGGGRGQGASATPPVSETPVWAPPSAPTLVLPPVMPPIPMQGMGGLDVVRLEQMKTLADILADRAARRDRRF